MKTTYNTESVSKMIESTKPYFFRMNDEMKNVFVDKFMTPEDWVLAIEAAGVGNTELVNELVCDFAIAAGKIVYTVSKSNGKIIPAILTSLDDENQNMTLTLCLSKTKFFVIKREDIDMFEIYADKSSAVCKRMTVLN